LFDFLPVIDRWKWFIGLIRGRAAPEAQEHQ